MLEQCPTSGRLLEQIEIKHGPVETLQSFVASADKAAQEKGVTLFFASLAQLVEVNKANSDTWRPLVPMFNPEMGGATPKTSFALIGRNSASEVVATLAARFYDWSTTTLHEESESLRMFVSDPEAAFKRGDKCEIRTPIAKAISGRVVFGGAVWYRPDLRGKGLSMILPRVSRAYAFTRWKPDFFINIMADAVVAGGLAERAGYPHVERDAVEFVLSPLGHMRGAIGWMDSGELLSDLRTAISGAGSISGAKIRQ
jgi:hypothetical protein